MNFYSHVCEIKDELVLKLAYEGEKQIKKTMWILTHYFHSFLKADPPFPKFRDPVFKARSEGAKAYHGNDQVPADEYYLMWGVSYGMRDADFSSVYNGYADFALAFQSQIKIHQPPKLKPYVGHCYTDITSFGLGGENKSRLLWSTNGMHFLIRDTEFVKVVKNLKANFEDLLFFQHHELIENAYALLHPQKEQT